MSTNRSVRRAILVAAIACAAFVLLSADSVRANLVVNGNFEAGDLTGWSAIPAQEESSLLIRGGHAGRYGVLFEAIDSYCDTITQSLPTVPGRSYTVDFWLGHYGSNNAPDTEFIATWDGSPVLSMNDNVSDFDWTEFTFVGTASGSTTEISFSGRDWAGCYSLDDVSVTSIPEPPALALLGLGVIGLFAFVRRQMRAE